MKIDHFAEDHAFLSNFYPATVRFEGEDYPTSEHAYQAAKTLDPRQRAKIRLKDTPGKAKRAGRGVTVRSGWNGVREAIMLTILRDKFSREPLRTMLADTGDSGLVEGNDWSDTFWGVSSRTGRGKNVLGILLMRVRAEIVEGKT